MRGHPAETVQSEPSSSRIDRARGALLGTFVGDALGMPFEGAAPDGLPDEIEMVEARRGRGTYTDDTQMMIALAESLLERGAVEEEHLARAFLEAYEPDRGYGAGTREVFSLWAGGTETASAAAQIFSGQGSRGNGAAMRIAPVAVSFADDPHRLRAEAERSARLTHAHPVGVDAAVVQAAAIGAALRDGETLTVARETARTRDLLAPLEEVGELLRWGLAPGEVAARLGNSSAGHESVPPALYAALAHGTFEEVTVFAVRCGGDTDTIAAMAGALAGARLGASAIPARWLEALEDGQRGRTHVEDLAARLAGMAQVAAAGGPPGVG